MGSFLMERTSTANQVLIAHAEWLPGVRLSIQYHLCSTYREDCEGWWLSGCCGSMAEHSCKPEVSQVQLLVTAGAFHFSLFSSFNICWPFSLFHLLTSKLWVILCICALYMHYGRWSNACPVGIRYLVSQLEEQPPQCLLPTVQLRTVLYLLASPTINCSFWILQAIKNRSQGNWPKFTVRQLRNFKGSTVEDPMKKSKVKKYP